MLEQTGRIDYGGPAPEGEGAELPTDFTVSEGQAASELPAEPEPEPEPEPESEPVVSAKKARKVAKKARKAAEVRCALGDPPPGARHGAYPV